jgi:hypothetical protein
MDFAVFGRAGGWCLAVAVGGCGWRLATLFGVGGVARAVRVQARFGDPCSPADYLIGTLYRENLPGNMHHTYVGTW